MTQTTLLSGALGRAICALIAFTLIVPLTFDVRGSSPAAAFAGDPGVDTDLDGINDADDIDDDNDGLLDSAECALLDCTSVDTDGDGRPNRLDLDSDNDGISDHFEVGLDNDADLDGRIDGFSDLNQDGLDDATTGVASAPDADNDGVPNQLDLDADNDGIPDFIEARPSAGYERDLGTTAGTPDPIQCAPGFIQIVNDTSYGKGQLFISDPITGANHAVGEAPGFSINSISYDPETELIYGIARQSGIDALGNFVANKAVVAIDLDGEVFLAHSSSPFAVSGAMLGRHLVGTGGSGWIVATDVDTGESSKIAINPKLTRNLADVIAVDNVLYGMQGGTFYRITDPLGTPVREEFPGLVVSKSAFGSAFSATNPDTNELEMYFFENATGKIYIVTDPTGPSPQVDLWGSAASSGSNDGTSCPAAAPPSAEIDTDGDGVPNWWDPDVDGDGVSNSGLVAPVNTDFADDGPDYLDLDSDEDTVADRDESGLTLSGIDANRDGIDDALEASYAQPDGLVNDPLTVLDQDTVTSTDASYREFRLPPDEAANGPVPVTREVVFVVDGSLSIDSSDWAIQLSGIAVALRDPAAFPTNGSAAVGMIQWSDGPDLEVPYTIIDSPETLEAIIDRVLITRQNLGGTSPETGIDAGNAMLAFNGSRDAEQILCVSTDGTPVNQSRVETAAALAQGSGIDSLAVLAIDDPSRGFDRNAADTSYSDVVFGPGSIVQARSYTEFASFIVSGCTSGDLSLVGLEVTQAVQDWAGSVPLVESKPTIVRAFMQSIDSSPDRVVARLHGERDGAALEGSPLLPLNPGGATLAYQDARLRRGDINASLNFELPDSWTAGDVTLRVEVMGAEPLCRETIAPAETCSATVSFDSVPDPQVDMFRVSYGDGSTTWFPTEDETTEQILRMESALPIADIDFRSRVLLTGDQGAPGLDELNAKLVSARAIDGAGSLYLGLLAGGAESVDAVESTIGAGSWFMEDAGDRNATGYGRNQGTKEFARAVGLQFASDANGTAWCSSPAEQTTDAPVHPFVAQSNGSDVAALGPLGDTETEIWGVDPRSVGSTGGLAVINPREVFSVMSFCAPSMQGSQGQWLDVSNYTQLLELLGTVDWAFGPSDEPQQQSADLQGAGDVSFFRGSIELTGDIATAELDDTVVVNATGSAAEQPPGDYRLDLFTADGTVIESIPFEPTPLEGDNGADKAIFNIPVAGDPDVERIVVSRDNVAIAQADASPNPPTVSMAAPLAGSSFVDTDVYVAWTGDDADNDPLSYLVQYSTDNGANYETIAIDYPGTELVIPADALVGSEQVRIRVTASDGVHAASAESPSFSIANTAPLVTITSPQPNQRFDGVQTVLLTGEASDAEDGKLDGANLLWHSDVSGDLGAGAQVVLNAGEIREGFHTVTATTSDSAGRESSSQVVMEIRRIAAPPEAPAECQGLTVTVRIAAGEVPTEGDDVIYGTPGDDVIAAKGGNDVICGLGGNDVVFGQAGDDIIFGDEGADRLRGGPGNDQVYGGSGADDVAGGSGNDVVYGEDGDDVAVRGGTGDDTVHGGAGNDALVAGNGGRDMVYGGDGNDKVTGGPRPDTVSGGNGDDEVKGNKGADTLSGGDGHDLLLGGPQRDMLEGGDGNDDCNGGTTGLGSDGLLALEADYAIDCETTSNIE